MDCKTATTELPTGLLEQINPIDDKIEFGDDSLIPEIVCKTMDIIKGQRRFPTALGMPDDALPNTGVEIADDRLCREDLREAHDMLLIHSFSVDVGERIA